MTELIFGQFIHNSELALNILVIRELNILISLQLTCTRMWLLILLPLLSFSGFILNYNSLEARGGVILMPYLPVISTAVCHW